MKKFSVLVAAAMLLSCADDSTKPKSSEPNRWSLKTDSVNVAVLVLDYQSYTFMGGTLNFYAPCADCASDSLPFDVRFEYPGDFGSILFRYNETGETIFYATIVWNGHGAIGYPSEFLPPDSFSHMPYHGEEPPQRQIFYYSFPYGLDQGALDAKADSCWAAIRSLDIVDAFHDTGGYRIGYYLYPPRVGVFNPAAARWIVFLFRENG